MRYYFCFFEFKPLWNSRWVDCICLNNPVLLTRSYDKVVEFKSKESICPSDSCRYCSNSGFHIPTHCIVDLDKHDIVNYVKNREINGNYKGIGRMGRVDDIPKFYINIEMLNIEDYNCKFIYPLVKIHYSWLPLPSPNNGIQYIEDVLVGKDMFFSQWKEG